MDNDLEGSLSSSVSVLNNEHEGLTLSPSPSADTSTHSCTPPSHSSDEPPPREAHRQTGSATETVDDRPLLSLSVLQRPPTFPRSSRTQYQLRNVTRNSVYDLPLLCSPLEARLLPCSTLHNQSNTSRG